MSSVIKTARLPILRRYWAESRMAEGPWTYLAGDWKTRKVMPRLAALAARAVTEKVRTEGKRRTAEGEARRPPAMDGRTAQPVRAKDFNVEENIEG